VGLGIGRLVFRALNSIEMLWAARWLPRSSSTPHPPMFYLITGIFLLGQ
jgi:hypothetical protein